MLGVFGILSYWWKNQPIFAETEIHKTHIANTIQAGYGMYHNIFSLDIVFKGRRLLQHPQPCSRVSGTQKRGYLRYVKTVKYTYIYIHICSYVYVYMYKCTQTDRYTYYIYINIYSIHRGMSKTMCFAVCEYIWTGVVKGHAPCLNLNRGWL